MSDYSLYDLLMWLIFPYIMYLCELFFPIWSTYASQSSLYHLLKRVILPYMMYICVLFFPIWSTYARYSFGLYCFMVAKSFPRKQFGWKNVLRNFLFAKSFLRNSLDEKKMFLEFFCDPKYFLVENFCCCKIISSETLLMKKFYLTKFFGRKIVWSKISFVAK